MANQYSDFFSSVAQPALTREAGFRGIGGNRKVKVGVHRMTFDLAPDPFAAGHLLRICTLKSSDQIGKILVTTDAASPSTALTANLGVFKSERHGGAVVDDDLFASALALNASQQLVDVFVESGNLTNLHRWRPLWFLADIGFATYTADPAEDWDLVWTGVVAIATADEQCLVEVEYITFGD